MRWKSNDKKRTYNRRVHQHGRTYRYQTSENGVLFLIDRRIVIMNVKLTRHLGRLKVDINGKLYAPLSFKSFRPNPTNISDFYKAGVRLFSVLSSGIINALGVPYSHFGESWIGDGEYDFSTVVVCAARHNTQLRYFPI